MKQTIMGVVIGAVVATGVSILLAQTPNWTNPRTWATDDLLTAGEFNTQFRDNLEWLRQDATLTGTDALDDLGCGTRGSDEVLYSDCDWAALPAGVVFDIHDDVGTAATIADADRLPFSDESVNGDPMRYTLASNLADYMQGEVELSANRVTSDTFSTARIPNLSASKITSDTLDNALLSNIPTASLANDAVTQAKIANNAVGINELKLGTGTFMFNYSGAEDENFNIPRYSYLPRYSRTGSRNVSLTFSRNSSTSITTSRMRVAAAGNSGSGTITAYWDNASNSDTPSVWVLLRDSDGTVRSIWEAEDPASIGDTVSPISIPSDDNDIPLPGYTVVNVGLPSLAVLEALYGAMTDSQQTDAQNALDTYLIQRGWLIGQHTHDTIAVDYAAVVVRYQPSVIQWAMRFAAQASDEGVTTFYLDTMVVSSGVWAIAP